MADSYDDYFAGQTAPAAPAEPVMPASSVPGPQILGEPPAPAPAAIAAPQAVAAAPTADAPTADTYDSFFKQYQRSQTSQAQAAFYQAKDTDPERAGKVLNLSNQMGVAPDYVARNYDDLQRDQTFGSIDIPKLSRLNPAIMKLASDPVKAAAVKDDLPGLQKTEDRVTEHTALEQTGNILAAAALEFAAGITKIPGLASDVFNYKENLARKIVDDPTRVTSADQPYGQNNPVTRYLEDQAKSFRRGAPILEENPLDDFMKTVRTNPDAALSERVMDAASQGDYTRASAALLAHGVSQAPMLIALFGGAALGVGPLATIALGAQTAADKNAANNEAGVDPVAGIPNAAMHGAIVTYMDRIGAFEYFTTVGSRLTQKFGPEVSKQIMRSYGGTLAETMGLEASKMAGMSVAGDFADFATGVNKDAFAGSIARAVNAGMLGAVIGASTTAPVEGFVRLQEARRARNAETLIKNLVADSPGKTQERSPELHSEFVRNTVEGTPFAEAQIAPEALETYFQSKGQDPVAAMQDLGFLDRFAHAKETGTKLRIPTEELVTQIQKGGHDDLAKHVTFHEEDSSVADLEARAEAERQVSEASKASLDQAETVALNAKGLTPEQQRQESGEQVREHIAQQLTDLGHNKQYATVIAKSIETMAGRANLDPLELYNRINFSVSGPDAVEARPDEIRLQQAADDTAEISQAKEVLNQIDTPEKAVALNGEEREKYLAALDTIYGEREKRATDLGFGDKTMYHGTGADIEAFNPAADNGALSFGPGQYLAENTEHANAYAFGEDGEEIAGGNVIPARIRTENLIGRDTRVTAGMVDTLRETVPPEALDFLEGNGNLVPGGKVIDIYRALQREVSPLEARDIMKKLGFDSAGWQGRETAVFDPEQIRSTNAAFDPRFKDSPLLLAQSDAYKEGALPRPKVDTFFSKLTRTVEEKMPNSAPPDQVRGILKEMKPEEKKWLQLDQFLEGKTKVSKAELVEFLRANNPQIVDVTKQNKEFAALEKGDEVFRAFEDEEYAGSYYSREEAEAAHPDATIERGRYGEDETVEGTPPGADPETKYDQWTLPGGENYREVLFTLPQQTISREEFVRDYKRHAPNTDDATMEEIYQEYLAEPPESRIPSKDRNYKSGHWSEENILAFTRLNDRVDAEGKRVLHVEEVQSDWHQEGRKKGYKGDADLTELVANAKRGFHEVTTKDGKFITNVSDGPGATDPEAAIAEARRRIKEDPKRLGNLGVPDAPFRKTWHEFALKKIIRMAAEGNYDKITWTTGEQQADRYSLAKHIERLEYKKSADQLSGGAESGYWITTFDKHGNSGAGERLIGTSKLEETVGKEIAQKIIAGEGEQGTGESKNYKTMSNLGVQLGGEGMKGFYDKIIPDYLRKFGKKYGATVGETELATPPQGSAEDAQLLDDLGVDGTAQPSAKVHSLDITPALKDAALYQGFELFQGGENAPRGQISISPDRINIQLLETANRSTFIHETGHFVVEMMRRLAPDSPQIKEDFDTLMKHVGNDGGEITREQHEEIARSFEAYMMEGKAPSKALRKAFVQMRTWLIDVYKNLTSLKVNLTDDVRRVFDRAIATDEEIAEAQSQMNFGTLFEGKAREMLSAEQYAKVGFAVDAAKAAAEDHLRAEVMNDIKKEETTAWAEGLDTERNKARAEAQEMQVFKAQALLQRGETPAGEKLPPELQGIKIKRQALVDLYGKEILEKLPKPLVYSKEGMHPDVVAGMLGYESGKAMVDELVSFPKLRDYVEEVAQSEMQKKDPDLYKSSRMPEEALKAIHNNEQAKVMRLEMEYLRAMSPGAERDLTRMISKQPPSDRVLKETVRQELGRMKFDDVRPNVYRVAERQAAAEAGKKLAAGDIDGAYEAKRKQLLNHELFRASTEARDDVTKSMKFFKKLNKSDEDLAKTRDTNLVNAARAILALNGIGKEEQAPKFYLEKMKAYDPEGFEAAAYHVANATNKIAMNYRENTMGAFREMTDSVRAIWDLARDAKTVEIEGKKIRKEEIVTDLVAQLGNTGDLTKLKPGMTQAVTPGQEKIGYLLAWRASLTRVEHWVHGKDLSDYGGVFTEHIWRPIQRATNQKIIKYAEMMRAYKAHAEKYKEIFTTKPIEAPELGYKFANKKELLGAMMHTGNESNLSKLLRGRNWGAVNEDGSLDRSRWDAFTDRMHREGVLGKGDYDFVQGIWDMYESIKPDAQKAHKKMFGYHFNEITNDPFTVRLNQGIGNMAGEAHEYRGGYAPAVADPYLVDDAAMRREAEAFGNHGNMMLMPTGGRGFTKSRVEGYAAPLALDLGYVPMAIDKVLRFTYVEGAARDVSKLVFDRRFAEALNTVDPGAHEMLISWLNRAAKQSGGIPSGQGKAWRGLDQFFRAVRTRTGLGAMAGNIVNAIHQTTGLSVVMSKVEPRYVRDALLSYIGHSKDVTEAIMQKSEYMRAHHLDPRGTAGEIEDILVNPTKIKTVEEWSKKNSYFLQRFTAGMTEAVAWTGAYNKALAEGKADGAAVEFADSVVSTTQHAMRPIDVAAYETGSPLYKMFTQFTGYYNNKANLLGSKAMASIRETGIKKAAIPLIGLYASVQMWPAIMAKSTYRAAAGKLDENDDGHYSDDLLNLFFGSQVDEALALAPFVGPTINYNLKVASSDRPKDERFVMAPGFALIEKLGMTYPHTRDAIKGRGKPSAAIKDWMTLIGLYYGVPTQPLAKPLGYMADVATGKVKSRGALDYARGLVTGTGPRH